MSLQRIFNEVARHLLKQGRKATLGSGYGCAYLASDGCKCAVGCLIPPENYDPSIERLPVDDSVILSRLPGWVRETDNAQGLLVDLQRVHDISEPHEWLWRLRQTADDWRLDSSVLEAATP